MTNENWSIHCFNPYFILRMSFSKIRFGFVLTSTAIAVKCLEFKATCNLKVKYKNPNGAEVMKAEVNLEMSTLNYQSKDQASIINHKTK